MVFVSVKVELAGTDEIGMELVQGQGILRRAIGSIVIHRTQQSSWGSPTGGRRRAIQIARQQPVAHTISRVGWDEKRDHLRVGIAGQAWARLSAYAPTPDKCAAVQELARADIVGIRPHASLWIIREIVSSRDGIAKVRARRIGVCEMATQLKKWGR